MNNHIVYMMTLGFMQGCLKMGVVFESYKNGLMCITVPSNFGNCTDYDAIQDKVKNLKERFIKFMELPDTFKMAFKVRDEVWTEEKEKNIMQSAKRIKDYLLPITPFLMEVIPPEASDIPEPSVDNLCNDNNIMIVGFLKGWLLSGVEYKKYEAPYLYISVPKNFGGCSNDDEIFEKMVSLKKAWAMVPLPADFTIRYEVREDEWSNERMVNLEAGISKKGLSHYLAPVAELLVC